MSMAWYLLAAVALLGAGCERGGSAPSAGTQPAATASAAVHTYHVRGIVRELPAAGDKEPEILVRHEAIPDFVDMNGKATGMRSMTMPFTLGPGVGVGELQVGDKVLMTFTVDWEQNVSAVTKIEKLPAETELNLPMMASKPAATLDAAPATRPAK